MHQRAAAAHGTSAETERLGTVLQPTLQARTEGRAPPTVCPDETVTKRTSHALADESTEATSLSVFSLCARRALFPEPGCM